MKESAKTLALIVDDGPGIVELISEKLAREGIETVSAGTAEEAETVIGDRRPDITLVDYSLPGRNGLQLMESVRGKLAAAGGDCPPFIVITGHGDERLAVEAMRLGAVDYLIKDAEFLSKVGPAAVRALREYKTRRQLAESESRFRTLFECGNDAAFVHPFGKDGVPGKFTAVNDVACARLGYTREELLDMGPADVDADGMDDKRRAALERLASTGHAIFIMVHKAKNGDRIPVEISASRFETAGGVFLVSICRDITERVKAETALRHSEARFRAFFSDLPMGVALLRPLDGGADFEFLDFSPEAERIEGLKKESVLGRKVTDVFPGVGALGLLKVFSEVLADGKPRTLTSSYYKDSRNQGWRENTVFRLPDGLIASVYRDTTAEETAKLEIREKEEKYRALLESLPDIVMNFDRELRHTYVSENVSLTGMEARQFLNRTHAELGFPPDLCRLLEEKLKSVFGRGKPAETEFEADLPTGRKVYNWRLTPQRDPDGEVVSVTTLARDITDYRSLETDYRQLFDSMLDGFALHEMILDGDGRPADYRFLRLNPAFERLTGLKAAETEGRTALEILGDDAKEWVEIYGKVALTGEPASFEKFIKLLDRYYAILAFRPRPGQFAAIFTDVTEQKKAETTLRENAAMLEMAGRFARFGAWSVDLAAGVCHWSDEVAAIHEEPAGFSPPLEKGINYYAPEWREKINAVFAACAGGGTPYDETMEIITAKGNRRWVRAIGRAERDADNRIMRVSGSFQDITDRKRMEEDLLKSQKVESLGMLAGGIAHDFNNILTGITANLSMLISKAGGEGETGEALNEALAAANTAKGLTRQLLAFAEGGKPLKKELDAGRAVAEAARLALRGSSCSPELNIAPDLWSVEADETQLSQVIVNLVTNAAQSMPGCGKVTVAAVNEGGAGSPSLKITVADTGTGIPGKYLKDIFDPYFTTKKQGHGLGLTMAYSIIKGHGGDIRAESEQGRGTVFTITLPATGRRPAGTPAVSPAPETGHGRVLVMDDEEVVLKACRRMITSLGYECALAGDGEAALKAYEAAAAEGKPFDAVIMDITIQGGMGGREAVAELRKKHPDAKVIASSGYASGAPVSEYAAMGFDGLLAKPYNYDEMAALLKKTIGGK
ncbi:MAG TPA: hypothetical protein DDW67_02135 [Elusimicrobia bacterium]|nr:hypothetical protein [Elusimicrobiota bacterium]